MNFPLDDKSEKKLSKTVASRLWWNWNLKRAVWLVRRSKSLIKPSCENSGLEWASQLEYVNFLNFIQVLCNFSMVLLIEDTVTYITKNKKNIHLDVCELKKANIYIL